MCFHCRAIGGTLALLASGLGCQTEQAPVERTVAARSGEQIFVRTSGVQAGPVDRLPAVQNPFAGNVHALRDGKRLYSWFNCNGCHGEIGGGGMGPPLADAKWIYGSGPANIYQSIVQGRPQGMPAFHGRLSEDDTWKLVAFVEGMGGTANLPDQGSIAAEPERTPSSQPQEERRHE